MRIRVKECKSIMTKSKLPDADYVINPYIGCCHQCIYCYAQFMSRFTGHTEERWGDYIDVKEGGKFPRGNLKGKLILIGSVTDPYNPLEKKYEATRKIISRLIDEGIEGNIEILTKSPLILRDLDLLKQIPKVRVGISLSTMDSFFTKKIEKNVVSPSERVELIKELHESGIEVYVFIAPIFPLFEGWKDVVHSVDGYVDMICFENLNLRANYKTEVFDMIKRHYPDKYKTFVELFNQKEKLRDYWTDMARQIDCYMKGKTYKLYFFHEEIRKD